MARKDPDERRVGAEARIKVAAPGGPPPTLVSPADPGELTFLPLGTRVQVGIIPR